MGSFIIIRWNCFVLIIQIGESDDLWVAVSLNAQLPYGSYIIEPSLFHVTETSICPWLYVTVVVIIRSIWGKIVVN